MWEYKHTEELYHYGVPGMKWGHRKRMASEDHVKSRELRKKKTSELSTNELKKLNDRLTAENNYRENLRKEKQFSPNVGKKIVDGFIKTAGTITAVVGAYKVYEKYGNHAIGKIGDMLIKNIKLGNLR